MTGETKEVSATLTGVAGTSVATPVVYCPLNHSDPIAALVGEVVSSWSLLEKYLQWSLDVVGCPAERQRWLCKGLLDHLSEHTAASPTLADVRRDVKLLNKDCYPSTPKGLHRNRIVHDAWVTDPATGNAGQWTNDKREIVERQIAEVEQVLPVLRELYSRAGRIYGTLEQRLAHRPDIINEARSKVRCFQDDSSRYFIEVP